MDRNPDSRVRAILWTHATLCFLLSEWGTCLCDKENPAERAMYDCQDELINVLCFPVCSLGSVWRKAVTKYDSVVPFRGSLGEDFTGHPWQLMKEIPYPTLPCPGQALGSCNLMAIRLHFPGYYGDRIASSICSNIYYFKKKITSADKYFSFKLTCFRRTCDTVLLTQSTIWGFDLRRWCNKIGVWREGVPAAMGTTSQVEVGLKANQGISNLCPLTFQNCSESVTYVHSPLHPADIRDLQWSSHACSVTLSWCICRDDLPFHEKEPYLRTICRTTPGDSHRYLDLMQTPRP